MNKEFNKHKALEYFQEEQSITEAAKRYCKEIGISYEPRYRHQVSRLANKEEVLDEDLENTTETETNQYSNDKDKSFKGFNAIAADGTMMSIEDYCKHYNLDYSKIRSWKSVTHTSVPFYNIAFQETVIDKDIFDEEFLSSIVEKYITPVKREAKSLGTNLYFDRLVITDVHIGMSTEGGRNVTPLYDTPWNKEILLERLEKTFDHVKKHKKGNILVVDELGDYVDGLFGQTTRKGHSLPQNMSDKECFDLAVEFKMTLVERLLGMYDEVMFNSITEDNHSGVYGYFVNSAVKSIVEQKYMGQVVYNIMEKFINHYTVGKHTFILSHGKDSESLKFGFKPILDAKQIEKIDQYCKEYQLYNGNYIEFSKGDSHQFIFDYSTSNDFDYFNYPAFSPPSNWVKSNFGRSVEACVFQNIDIDGSTKINIPLIF